MSGKFVILYLSDLHMGNPDSDLDSLDVLEPLLEDIQKMVHEKEMRPNLIVFGGDLVFGDTEEAPIEGQLTKAETWIRQLRSTCDVSADGVPILLVPGNHDINRNSIVRSDTQWLASLRDKSQLISQIRTRTPRWLSIASRQEQWSKAAKKLMGSDWKWDDEHLICTRIFDIGDMRIGIVGLNSSWSSRKKKEKGQLRMGRFQLQQAIQDLKNCDVKIAVMHHPISWLLPSEEGFAKRKLQKEFQVFMHGHEHDAWIIPVGGHLVLEGGACYQGSSERNEYSWLDLELENRKAFVYLREFNEKGSGWGGLKIAGMTDEEGRYDASSIIFKTAAGGLNGPERGRISSLRSAIDVIKELEKTFKFVWESQSFSNHRTKFMIYWPVRLRHPTPIHAVQAFAATSLASRGGEIYLCLDDLDAYSAELDVFSSRVQAWMKKLNGDATRLHVNRFSELITDTRSKDIWVHIRKWLNENQLHELRDVLKLSKTWPADEKSPDAISNLAQKSPRRILNPAMVWAGLYILHKSRSKLPIITLGGYDEKPLWGAWREVIPSEALSVGHLYAPALYTSREDGPEKLLHMNDKKIAWVSKDDIYSDLLKEFGTAKGSWNAEGRLCAWALQGCVLLPKYLAGLPTNIKHDGHDFNSIEDFGTLSEEQRADVLSSEIARWIL